MLVKLLKYDLKYMLKNMIIFYILTIFFSISTRILFAIDDSVILKIISQISLGCMFSMMASILINTLMRSWVRFRDSIYKDEAYLTHTLPVTKNDIYNSKLFQTLIFFVISFSVIVIGLFIAYYTKDRWILLKDFINNFTTSINFSTSFFIVSVLSILFLEIFNALQCGYLGLLLGYRRNNGKIGFSVLFGFIAYILSQSMVLFLTFILGIFNSNIMDLFKKKSSGNVAKDRLKLVLVSDRANCSSEMMEMMKRDIIEVISRYMDIDAEALDVKITETESDSNNGMVPALVANIPIRDMKHRPDPR